MLLSDRIPEEIWADATARGMLDARDVIAVADAIGDHTWPPTTFLPAFVSARPLSTAERDWFAARSIVLVEPTMQRHLLPSMYDTRIGVDGMAIGLFQFPPLPLDASPFAAQLNDLGVDVDCLPICFWTLGGKLHCPPDDRPAVECTLNVGRGQQWREQHMRLDSPEWYAWCDEGANFGAYRTGEQSALAACNIIHRANVVISRLGNIETSYAPKVGTQFWLRQGKLHRDNDLPAIIWGNDVRREWYQDGVRRAHHNIGAQKVVYS